VGYPGEFLCCSAGISPTFFNPNLPGCRAEFDGPRARCLRVKILPD
jgi:hypothetical protein